MVLLDITMKIFSIRVKTTTLTFLSLIKFNALASECYEFIYYYNKNTYYISPISRKKNLQKW